ncbi:serine/threonine protein kinase [Sandaracinus amylolyticus]|uniref:Serine/threonine protein kinase n=1 Tax=Sandaracinus amylolyticus TaxID=927083 RepID=A0A0F6YFA1_9BACT|nr:serine/threonine protein kinase [Sandaracinus amylolyticus]
MLATRAKDPQYVRRFQDEARLAALLRHPNVVSLYDFGCHAGTWWQALELVDGVDLDVVVHRMRASGEPLPVDVVLYIAAELSKALAYAHELRHVDGAPARVVHRDVSPSNVLISYDGAVKLADFGIAKIDAAERTESGGARGKVSYTAPEQALGMHEDRRADLFALGVVLFELFSGGVRPFDGLSDLATFRNTVEGRRHDLREVAPHLPEPVVALVDGLLATERHARTATADDVLDALGAMQVSAVAARDLARRVRASKPPVAIPTEGELTRPDPPHRASP